MDLIAVRACVKFDLNNVAARFQIADGNYNTRLARANYVKYVKKRRKYIIRDLDICKETYKTGQLIGKQNLRCAGQVKKEREPTY